MPRVPINTSLHVGKRYGKLLVLSYSDRPNSVTRWLCRCDCGKEVLKWANDFPEKRKRQSCGCDKTKKPRRYAKPGDYPRPHLAKLRSGIIHRCYSKKARSYRNYGGRGITLFEPWRLSLKAFMKDVAEEIGERPSKKHSIDRINNDGNYEPGNIRWATARIQGRNKRTNVFIEYGGERKTLSEWAQQLDIVPTALKLRLDRMGVEEAMTYRKFKKGKA